jgi:prepilin-type N-terminal cleavage/methylation domain-containing protein
MRAPQARPGFTLVEIIVAMTLTLLVFAITLPFVRAQSRSLGSTAGRLDADQVARFAQRTIDRDLRVAVSDPGQPLIVYAGELGISFNANLLARDTLDPAALEVDATADSSLTEAWRVANAAVLPLTTTTYPTVNYTDADGLASKIETISYFLHPDTISGRSDVYVLYRRVNARDSVQLVRGIHVPEDSSFFTYFTEVNDTLAPIAVGSLPLLWTSTTLANVRAVGIRSGGFFRNRQVAEDVVRTVHWRTILTNAPQAATAQCTAAPAAATGVGHSKQTGTGSNAYHVRVTWTGSTDDSGGSSDVTHYVVWVRYNTTPVTWVRVASVPARRISGYRYDHYQPTLSGSVRYGVTAVNCAGLSSAAAESSPLNLSPG